MSSPIRRPSCSTGRAGCSPARCSDGRQWIDDVYLPFTRHTGPNLSPFNAWLVLKSLETLDLRVRRACENAAQVAAFLEGRVPKLLYPGLASHPQHAIWRCARWQLGGTIIALFVADGAPRRMRCSMASNSSTFRTISAIRAR